MAGSLKSRLGIYVKLKGALSICTVRWYFKWICYKLSSTFVVINISDTKPRLKKLAREVDLDIDVLKNVPSKTFEARNQQG